MTDHHDASTTDATATTGAVPAPAAGELGPVGDLYPEGSVLDLVLRGFDRDQVLAATGEDPGYNGRAVRERLAGVDRKAYRGAHVRERVPEDVVVGLLEAYAAGGRAEDLRDGLGMGGSSSVKLKDVFAAAGLTEEFAEADRARRRFVMQRGMAAAHGVSNPFEMDSVQRKAAQTRQQRYGAAYTLQAGSALAESARAAIAARMADPQARARVLARRRRPGWPGAGWSTPCRIRRCCGSAGCGP